MRENDVVVFEDYCREARFRIKRPDMKAGGDKAVGGNIYHRGPTGKWQEERSLSKPSKRISRLETEPHRYRWQERAHRSRFHIVGR